MKTVKGGTWTTEGFIPHKKHPAGFDMPVKLLVSSRWTVDEISRLQSPLKSAPGSLIYALPGGGYYV